jgi:hypothetical protein
MRRWIAVWFASLIVVAGLASVLTRAQTGPGETRVVSGADIGFRVDAISATGQPTGTLVIRVKGEWVPVAFTPDVRRAH